MMKKIIKNHYVDVRGWSEEEINQAAEAMAEHIGCKVDCGDLHVTEEAFILKYSGSFGIWAGVDIPDNPIRLNKHDFFGEGGYCSNKVEKEINPNRKPGQENKSNQEVELSINFNDGVVVILKGSDEEKLKRIARHLIE